MSYQVLARKWRPKVFSELMGQEHVVTVLVNALTQQRLHHAYLFTGTRGVGKTTIARIFAKSLNCEQGITATPCGKCDACLDIDQGRFVDLLEIDAASKTKVDDTREILDNVQYAPTRGRYKVYLIDEVHMLSRSSFNALLKTLEEPPEHVKFILATTDPQKLPVTVLSRCLQFHLKALTIQQISDKISEILHNENISFDDDAIALLAKAARGSMRDCLSLTDQCIAQGNGAIVRNDVQQMLGGVNHDWVYKIVIILLKQDPAALMKLSLEIASYAPSYSRLSAELLQLLHQIAMAQIVETSFSLSTEHQHMLNQFCQLMSPEDVQLYYQIVLNTRKDLPYADDEQAAFDMMLLRLLAFKPVTNSLQLPVGDTNTQQEINEVSELLENISSFKEHTDEKNILEANTAKSISAEHITDQPTSLHSDENNHGNFVASQHQQRDQQVDDSYQVEALRDQENKAIDTIPSKSVAVELNTKLEKVLDNKSDEALNNEQDANTSAFNASLTNTSLSETDEKQEAAFQSPVADAIATRNMLRSRKKSLEVDGKKSSDATMRHSNKLTDKSVPQVQNNEALVNDENNHTNNIEALTTAMPQQPYHEDVIDPTIIKHANQVDQWAHMIDSMSLTARLRQLAIHATIDDSSTDDVLLLQLNQSMQHLNSDAAHKQLEERISVYLQRKVTVELAIVEQTIADPYQIQSDINSKRYEYAKQLLAKDNIVIALQEHFQATLDQENIVAR